MPGVNTSKRLLHLRHWVLGMPLVAMPLLLGGTRPWLWGSVVGLFFIGIVALLWLDEGFGASLGFQGISRTPVHGKWLWIVGILLIYPFFQALPLYLSWLAVLSPRKFEWLEMTSKLTGIQMGASSISYDPLATAMAGIFWIFLAVYAWVFSLTLQEEGQSKWLWNLLFILIGIEAFYGLIQVLIPSVGVLSFDEGQSSYRGMARGTFINKNHYGAFLGMIWPVLLAKVVTIDNGHGDGKNESNAENPMEKTRRTERRQKQVFFSFVLGLVLLALVFSQSRGATLAAIVALTVFAVLRGSRGKSVLILTLVLWTIVICYGAIIGFDQVLERFDRMEAEAPGRFRIWEDTWRMAKDHLWFGTGLGSYDIVFGLYQSSVPEGFRAGHAHNDYVELAAELGLPVGVGVVLLVWGYWWRCLGRIRRAEGLKASDERGRIGIGRVRTRADSVERSREEKSRNRGGMSGEGGLAMERKLVAVGALAGGAAFLLHCWVEFNWQIPANQLYFIMLLVIMGNRTAVGVTSE